MAGDSAGTAPDFLVHDQRDMVGVVVVEGVEGGRELSGWVMDTDETVTLGVEEPIPLGHKIALRDIARGETVLKYGEDIGRAVADIGRGRHVHVHNLKTKKW
jgi:(2R)-sulfolactate sulfo-lyase subunit alpha